MRNRILGSILIVLTVFGGIRLFNNMRAENHFGSSEDHVVSAKFERSSEAEVMIDKSFSVADLSRLAIDVSHSDIVIETGNVQEATVRVELQSRNMSRAKERFENMEWEVYSRNGALHVEAESPRGNWNLSMSINVFVTIPEVFDLALQTSHGDVDLETLNGEVMIATSHGDVRFESIEGSRIEIRSSHGDISGRTLQSDNVMMETSHADIELDEVNSKQVYARTSHADISIRYLTGESEISTSHGDIQLYLAGGDHAELQTQHGDIELKVDGNVGSDLDLEAQDVHVDRSMKVSGETSRKRVDGAINGGGRVIRARTTHGSIDVDAK